MKLDITKEWLEKLAAAEGDEDPTTGKPEYIPGFVPSAADRHYGRIIAAYQARVSELEAGIKRLSDEEELCDETTGDDPFSIVRLAAKLAAAEEARAEQWRLRRDAEASRDAMRAAADSLLQDRKALIEAIQPLLGCADYARENDLSGHETLIVTASEAREAAMVVERISAEEDDND